MFYDIQAYGLAIEIASPTISLILDISLLSDRYISGCISPRPCEVLKTKMIHKSQNFSAVLYDCGTWFLTVREGFTYTGGV